MATPNEKLASSLKALKALQDTDRLAIRASDLTRTHRERLVSEGYLRPIVKGWYMPSRPEERPGDSTAWTMSIRQFIRGYCDARFGEDWFLAAEQSLLLHAAATTLQLQIQVRAPRANNNRIELPNGSSIFEYQTTDFPDRGDVVILDHLRVLSLPLALCRVAENFFRSRQNDARICLLAVRDPSDLLKHLASPGQPVVAGRLAGAMRAIGRPDIAERLKGALEALKHTFVESNPFVAPVPYLAIRAGESAYAIRIRALWADMRGVVIAAFPAEPEEAIDIEVYMKDVDDRYVTDAYHSLSIEGYHVSDALIQKVSQGDWSPDNPDDRKHRDAMAARGYYLAHLEVKKAIRRILLGENPGMVLRQGHSQWYQALFAPSVTAGILLTHQLAGYRNDQVFIKNAHHVPPSKDAVRDAMPVLFELLEAEPSAAARAVLGHYVFVYIHPYMDGNGRIGRFLMNCMLASGGYPWTVIQSEHRDQYMSALDRVVSDGDIGEFAAFVGAQVSGQMGTKPRRR